MNSPAPSKRLKSLASISNQALSQERDKLENYRKKMEESLEALKNASSIEDNDDFLLKEKAYKKAQSEFVMQQSSYKDIERAAFKVEAQLRVSHWLNKQN